VDARSKLGHFHLSRLQEAGTCLRQARELLGKDSGNFAEERVLLREAETLIEGNER
jgi:hypothetical protein